MSYYTLALRNDCSDCLCKQISFWMLGFLLVLFCLWILIPIFNNKCQIRSDQIRGGSQAEKVKLSPKLILQRCDGLFNWPYVQDFCMWAILTPCLWFSDACVWCVQQSMCVVMRFCLFWTHCAAVVWEIASVYTFTVEQIRINIIMINKTAMKTKGMIFLLTKMYS